MGNLDDYNKHKLLGPAAGRPDSIGAHLGQREHLQWLDRSPQNPTGGTRPPGLHAWLDRLPAWLMARPIRWGCAVMVAGHLVSLAPLPAVLRALAGLAALFGTLWLVLGLVAFIARRVRG